MIRPLIHICSYRNQMQAGSSSKPPNGFTLLEVLVASALMGLVLVVVMQLMSAGLTSLKAVRLQGEALLVAERVLGDYCQNRALKPGTFSGNEGKFAYQVRLEPQYTLTIVQGLKATCYHLKVTVAWREGGHPRSVALESARTVFQRGS